jgi:iron complex outermembrane receptor protein
MPTRAVVNAAGAAVVIVSFGATARAADGGLEEVVVTAQRRAESVQTVPIAISAFTPAELERRNVARTLDLVNYVPNLVGHNNTGLGNANTYFIRGIGNTETIPTFDPPVATYVDDIYVARQNANNLSFFDIERLEVLRGPQGTLFGRNTTGGAINVISRKAADTFGGYVDAGFGAFSRAEVRGSVDVPVTANLRTKLSGYWLDDDGYVKNSTTGERLNDQRAWGVRGALQARFGERVVWDLSAFYTESDTANLLNFHCDRRAPTACSGRWASTGLRKRPAAGETTLIRLGININPNGAATFAPTTLANGKDNLPFGEHLESTLASSNVQIALGDATLSVITGYVGMRQQYTLDFFDGSANPTLANLSPAPLGLRNGGFALAADNATDQFTQEVKLNGSAGAALTYVTGVYYFRETNSSDFADISGAFPGSAAANAGFLGTVGADRLMKNGTRAWAAYGQADYRFSPAWMATVGLRYTDERKDLQFVDQRDARVQPVVGGLSQRLTTANVQANGWPTEQSTRLWTPRVALNWQATNDLLVFATATRGFKSGGWAARATAPRTANNFGPEKAWSYELGVKSEWFDRRLRANVTAFHTDVKGLQTTASASVVGGIVFLTNNYADLRNDGVELELAAVPVDGLNLYLNAGFQDAKYLNPVPSIVQQQGTCRTQLAAGLVPGVSATACASGIVTATGDIAIPVRTPRHTIAFGGSYEWRPALLHGFALIPSANAAYTSEAEMGVANFNLFRSAAGTANAVGSGTLVAGSRAVAHWLTSYAVALESPNGMWRVSASCDNCGNAFYTQSQLSNFVYPNPPRTWQARVRVRF